MSVEYVLGVCLILLTLVIVRLLLRRDVRRRPPGPWGLPILGYLPWIDPQAPHQSLTDLVRKYGPVCGLKLGSLYTVLLADPQLVRQALAKEAFSGRAPLYVTHGIMQGYGESYTSIIILSFYERCENNGRASQTQNKNTRSNG